MYKIGWLGQKVGTWEGINFSPGPHYVISAKNRFSKKFVGPEVMPLMNSQADFLCQMPKKEVI